MDTQNSSKIGSGAAVIICAYTEERWDQLVAAVQSVQAQTLPAEQVVIVIDHNPALLSRAQERFPDCTVIENSEPKGLSGARNSGIAVSTTPLIGFVDDDATLEPDWLQNLTAIIQSDPMIMGAGGRIIPMWESAQPLWMPEEFFWVVGCTHKGVPETRSDVRNLIGANMLIRRDVFERVGGFRTGIGRVDAIPLGCEETELCIRVRQAIPSARFIYDPTTKVYHSVPHKRIGWSYYRSRCYAEGLSKAQIAKWVGQKDGLSSERTHALKTLPMGVINGIRDALVRGDGDGLKRAGAIVAGLMITTAGYMRR